MRRWRFAGVPRPGGDTEELAGADRLPLDFGSVVVFGAGGGGLGDDLCSLTERPDDAPTGSEVFRRLVLETTPDKRRHLCSTLSLNKVIPTGLYAIEYNGVSPNTGSLQQKCIMTTNRNSLSTFDSNLSAND